MLKEMSKGQEQKKKNDWQGITEAGLFFSCPGVKG